MTYVWYPEQLHGNRMANFTASAVTSKWQVLEVTNEARIAVESG